MLFKKSVAIHLKDSFIGKSLRARWQHRMVEEITRINLLGSVLVCVVVKNCVDICGFAAMVIVDALSVKNTVEESSVCVIFSADSVMISELKEVVVINSDVTNVEPGSVVVSIRVSLIVNVKVLGGLEVVKVKRRLEISVTV
jgi:hypothetical protein